MLKSCTYDFNPQCYKGSREIKDIAKFVCDEVLRKTGVAIAPDDLSISTAYDGYITFKYEREETFEEEQTRFENQRKTLELLKERSMDDVLYIQNAYKISPELIQKLKEEIWGFKPYG